MLSTPYWHVFAKILFQNLRYVLDGCTESVHMRWVQRNHFEGILYNSIQCVDGMQLFEKFN